MKVRVECRFIIEIDAPDEVLDADGLPEYPLYFDIEDNHCPGTGLVGAALDRVMERAEEEGWCWACALGGTCKIVGVGEVPS